MNHSPDHILGFSLAGPHHRPLYYARFWGKPMARSSEYAHLSMGRFRFAITLCDRARLPEYKGGTLRGAFGHVFKKIVCSARQPTCEKCILMGTCPYTYIFETPRPDDARMMRLYPQIPRPFVLEPPATKSREFQPGDKLEFGLVLIGKATSYLPYFIFTFEQLGEIGIGSDRAKFQLTGVTELLPAGEERAVYSTDERKVAPAATFSPADLTKSRNGDDAALLLQTPLRLQVGGRIARSLEFRPLVSTLLRRVSALSCFHCGHELDLDFRRLVESADSIQVREDRTTWHDWDRFSGRQKRRMNLGGLVGSVTFSGPLDEYWPLLEIGEVVHAGKATPFGLGKFRMLNSNPEPNGHQEATGVGK